MRKSLTSRYLPPQVSLVESDTRPHERDSFLEQWILSLHTSDP